MLQQVGVAGSSTLAKVPGMYYVATLTFSKCSLPGQKDSSCSSDIFFLVWFHLLYPLDD